MNYQKFITSLKNGGIKIVVIYSIFSIVFDYIFSVVSGKNIIFNSFGGFSKSESAILLIITFLAYLIITPGLYGSSKDVMDGKLVLLSSFLQNSKKYFWSTIGYTFVYSVPFVAVMTILSYFIPFIATSETGKLIPISLFQSILVPMIILKVIGKYKNGFIKKNLVILLLLGFITCSIELIPVVGEIFFCIINGFYPLLILSMYDNIEIA